MKNYKKRLIWLLAGIILTACSFIPAKAAPGDLDITFGSNGFTTQWFNPSVETAAACLIQPDGKLILVGTISEDNTTGATNIEVRRYSQNGGGYTLDTSFSGGGIAFFPIGTNSDRAMGAALQADGKILITGDYWNGTNWDVFVMRLQSNGFADQTFGTFGSNGIVKTAVSSTTDTATSIAIQSDGKIVVAGYTANAGTDSMVLRYNSNGSLDTSFDGDGKAFASFTTSTERFNSVAIQSNGKIVAAGYAYITGTARDFSAARFNTNGSLDTTFSGDGKVTTPISTASNDEANAVKIQTDGKIVLAGSATSQNSFGLVRYNTNGTLDSTFDTDGKLNTNFTTDLDAARDLVIQSDGKLVAVGFATDGKRKVAAARYNSNGSLDPAYGTNGKVISYGDGEAVSAKLMSNGTVVAAIWADYDGNRDMAYASFQTNGYGGSNNDTPVSISNTHASALQPDGKTVLAGTFDYWNFRKCTLMRLNADGSLDTSFNGDGRVATNFTGFSSTPCTAYEVKVQADGKIVMAGSLGDYGFLARFNSNGSLDTSFNGTGYTQIYTGYRLFRIAIDATGNIYAISSSSTEPTNLFRFLPSGALDPSYDGDGILVVPGSFQYLRSLELQPDGKPLIVGGYFDTLFITRLNTDGAADTSFSGDGAVSESFPTLSLHGTGLRIQSDGKLVIAFTAYNYGGGVSGPYNFLIRYNANGSRDTAFGSGGTGQADYFPTGPIGSYIHGVAIQSDGKITTGSTMIPGNPPQSFLNRFSSTGAVDPAWGNNGLLISNTEVNHAAFYTMQMDPLDRITAAGDVSNGYIGVARYLP
ncbi:MAG: hypothetical protein WBD27_10630 [Pyrinomonadaceae bacterium]